MDSAGVNNINVPANPGAGSQGTDPDAVCLPLIRCPRAPLSNVAKTSAGSEESTAAAARSEDKVCTVPPSLNSDVSTETEKVSTAAINVAAALLPGESSSEAAAPWLVWFGSVALAGRAGKMEDAVSLHPSFCVWADGEPMHFFAVFDGHGGPHVAALCQQQMHVILAEELAIAAEHYLAHRDEEGAEERAWRTALSKSFARVDALAPAACACGRVATPTERCACPLSSGQRGKYVGSTAVVALLVRDRLVVANCGDSRAVLCRGVHAVPLSEDHKPNRLDEMARMEAAGGQVIFTDEDGVRVNGILAMSRAIGDELLKPVVICEPEITITVRSDDDNCLILASDGLWDMVSNRKACNVARKCIEDGSVGGGPVGHQLEPPCYYAAAVLAELALRRELRMMLSYDNISVVVIDLKARV